MKDADNTIAALSLLTPTEPPAVEIVNASGSSSAVLVCDHASNRVPMRLGSLGLEPHQLADHIGWDPGAADVTRQLSALLDAPLLLSGYSRLVIDCNRPLHSEQSIVQQSDGVLVSGNHELTTQESGARINTLFQPYHRAIDQLLDERSNRPNVVLSLHSFTPVLNGKRRPWHIGICYGRDRRLAALLLKTLAGYSDFVVGDNQPYSIDDDTDYTIPVHAERRGLPNVMIEIRQDEIRAEAGVAAWAERLAQVYLLIEAEALRLFGSRFVPDPPSSPL